MSYTAKKTLNIAKYLSMGKKVRLEELDNLKRRICAKHYKMEFPSAHKGANKGLN